MSPIKLAEEVPAPSGGLKPSVEVTNGNETGKLESTDSYHPLDELTPSEIVQSCDLLRHYIAEKTGIKAFKFIYCALQEPPKLHVLEYLGIPTEPGQSVPTASTTRQPRPARETDLAVIDLLTGHAYEAVVQLSPKTSVTSFTQLPDGVQPSLTVEELLRAEELCRSNPIVVKLCEQVGVSKSQLYCDGWSIGIDERFPQSQRIQQCILYARKDEHENLYAHPMDFFPIFDNNTGELLTIDFAAKRNTSQSAGDKAVGSAPLTNGTTKPPHYLAPNDCSADDAVRQLAGRDRISPPMESFDFLADLIAKKDASFKVRDDLKPLIITQPEGVSFELKGGRICWQGWDVHVSFHHREGLVLSTVTYNDRGTVRPVLYRMSIAEMVVPYGDPAFPHPRKFAFDVGEYGMGMMANDLTLGCDCRGAIAYRPGAFVNHSGQAEIIEKAICIHEEDAGVLWKHTDYRVGGRGQTVRSRKLVISSSYTVANYEYLVYWNFYQDGSIECEVRLTGILNLSLLDKGESPDGFGTLVAPQVNAHNHQHLFALRVDPMIDGLRNSVCETDVVPVEAPAGSDEDYHGNGFYAKKTIFDTAEQATRMYNNETGRVWSLINESKKHYASGQPVGYKIMCKDFPPLFPKPDSWVAKRAAFATKHLWVTQYQDGQLYPAGKHVPQTRDSPEDSLPNWIKGEKSIRNEDVVAYVTFGVTHLPRPEDFPVMPVEHCRLLLKPVGFFDQNPALDVPGTVDEHSKLAFATRETGASNGAACCK